jgi:hypothetical protein
VPREIVAFDWVTVALATAWLCGAYLAVNQLLANQQRLIALRSTP